MNKINWNLVLVISLGLLAASSFGQAVTESPVRITTPVSAEPRCLDAEMEQRIFSNYDQEVFVKQMIVSKASWSAAVYADFQLTNKTFIESKLGLYAGEENTAAFDKSEFNLLQLTPQLINLQCFFLPSSLDLRIKFPQCTSISTIRNQFNCGSCWAVSSMASLSDRYCIRYSNGLGAAQRAFSYQDVTSCADITYSAYGCSGGYMFSGYMYAKIKGVCTGEQMANTFLCKPYNLPGSPIGACTNTCKVPVNYPTPYTFDRYKVTSYNQITGLNLAAINFNMRCALNTGGTIIAGFTVYQDFFNYLSGVYSHISGGYAGRHAIRIIGYGTYLGTPYWLCANSWGTGWGDNGYFKIKRGTNEVSIESDVWKASF